MPSGTKLTEQQVDAILRLAGEQDMDGEWLLSYAEVAKRVGLSHRTVERVIRRSAVKLGYMTAWQNSPYWP